MNKLKYTYKNCPVPGGGYVTGFMFHPTDENILYIRTDIGGTYKYDRKSNLWHCLNEDAGLFDRSLTYPAALCLDEADPDYLAIISGCFSYGNYLESMKSDKGTLSISKNQGESFKNIPLPFLVHGNFPGRGSGYCFVQNPVKKDTLYYASKTDGLYKISIDGESLEKLLSLDQDYTTFVFAAPDGKTIIVGTAGVLEPWNERCIVASEATKAKLRAHSLFISYDEGKSFEKVSMPENHIMDNSVFSGYVPLRYAYDGKYFYVTLSQTGEYAYWPDLSYSCDTGCSRGGRVLRYSFDEAGRISDYTDITPTTAIDFGGEPYTNNDRDFDYVFGGISTCPKYPGLLTTATLSKHSGDIIYISKDYGDSWEIALFNLEIGNISFETSYMRPEFNGNVSLIHWLSDLKINPHDPDEVWFTTGTGVFRGINFTKYDRSFKDCSKGIEETVHLNCYSPIEGPVKVLDIIGDLGGFAFTDLDKPCENSFADAEGNRYITCQNADYSDIHPATVIATARGNWRGKTKGGLILSKDYGLTWDRLPLPYGINAYLDGRFTEIEKPNVNAGFVALSPDTKNIVFEVSEGSTLYAKGIITGHRDDPDSNSFTFEKTRIYDIDKNDISDSELGIKVFSDRLLSDTFYGFADGFRAFVSTDCGKSFYEIEVNTQDCDSLKNLSFGYIENAENTEIRPENGKSGVFYAALNQAGLFKLRFSSSDSAGMCLSGERLTKAGDEAYYVGLGILSETSDYLRDNKAVYICGTIDNYYGFFQSLDDGKTWTLLNDKKHQFGDIRSIEGDSRTFGRFFIASGSFGLKYGEPC